jgi:hypothetical protein
VKYIFILLTVCSLTFYSCLPEEYANHQGPDFDEYMSVEEYINFLVDNKYNHTFIPILSPEDIPPLLEISQSKILIDKFPRNPLSSYGQNEVKLGFVALWSIESIRKSYNITDMDRYGRFPSSNSVPVMTDLNYQINESDSILDFMVEQYKNWWDKNKLSDFNYYRFINPLESTGLRWK